jgi:hypothetical protein
MPDLIIQKSIAVVQHGDEHHTKMVPPVRTSPSPPSDIYLTIGQDYESIRAYLDDIRSAPHAYMVYTDLQTLVGLWAPVNYGTGVEYANGVINLSQQYFPTNPLPSLQIGLWLNGTLGCQGILNRQYQAQIEQFFRYCVVDCAALKIYLRIGYEFDNPDFHYTPELYKSTFQYLVLECDRLYSSKCREKIEFVWHSWAATTYTSSSISQLYDYYPGDDFVDWIGISIFSQLYTLDNVPPKVTTVGTPATVRQVCEYAQHHGKRIMIAESTPFGGIDQLNDPWSDWFVPVLELIDDYRSIQMWSYIYCNWNVQPMWQNAGFGDSRLSQNETLVRLWRHQVVSNPRFFSPPSHSDGNVTSEPPLTMMQLFPSEYKKNCLGSFPLDQPSQMVVAACFLAIALQNAVRRWLRSSTRKALTGQSDAAAVVCSMANNEETPLSQTTKPIINYGTTDTRDERERR